jgi:hypothetical protein
MTTTRKHAGLIAVGIAAAAAFPLVTDTVNAADHLEAPKTQANIAADITDVYAWHTGDGKIVAVLNFAGFNEAGLPAKFDAGVLYMIHVDNDNDNVSDFDTLIRFGQDSGGNWGVQVTGLPGSEAAIEGPVGMTIPGSLGLRVWAGLRDDPFFFDLDGFKATVQSGSLSFDPANDTFAKTNVNSIIVEMSTDAVGANDNKIRLWASTRVKP